MIKLAKIFSILIVVTFILTGCAMRSNVKFREEEKIVKSIDFTKYREKGFLITPGEYGENFESVGMFWFTIYPSCHRREEIISPEKRAALIGSGETSAQKSMHWEQEPQNLQKVLDLVYQEALSRKADGIIRLEIKEVKKTFWDGDYKEQILGMEISGLLIKRRLSQ